MQTVAVMRLHLSKKNNPLLEYLYHEWPKSTSPKEIKYKNRINTTLTINDKKNMVMKQSMNHYIQPVTDLNNNIQWGGDLGNRLYY